MREHVKVIISRYREDIAWASKLGYDYIVYNKDEDSLGNSIQLPNIGREAHTYLTHIVCEYDDLADMNIFLQGDPFDHIDDRGRGSVDTLRTMLEDVVDKGAPFKGLAWFKLKCDTLGRPHDLHDPENEGRWAGWGRDIPVGELFEKIFAADVPAQIIARAPAGLFCVSGERIRTRPRAFYEYVLKLIADDPQDERNTGHAIERLWQYVFNGNMAWNRDEYGK